MAELKGTADEIKADLLWVAQESLRSNLVHGTAGNFSARLPDGNVALTPSSASWPGWFALHPTGREAYLVACAESTRVGKVASFDRSIDRVDTIERIEPPPV